MGAIFSVPFLWDESQDLNIAIDVLRQKMRDSYQ